MDRWNRNSVLFGGSLFLLSVLSMGAFAHGPAVHVDSAEYQVLLLVGGDHGESSRVLEQRLTYWDCFQRTWTDSELVFQESVPGGMAMIEASLLERASPKIRPE